MDEVLDLEGLREDVPEEERDGSREGLDVMRGDVM